MFIHSDDILMTDLNIQANVFNVLLFNIFYSDDVTRCLFNVSQLYVFIQSWPLNDIMTNGQYSSQCMAILTVLFNVSWMSFYLLIFYWYYLSHDKYKYSILIQCVYNDLFSLSIQSIILQMPTIDRCRYHYSVYNLFWPVDIQLIW